MLGNFFFLFPFRNVLFCLLVEHMFAEAGAAPNWDAEIVERVSPQRLDTNAFSKTKTLSFISRSSSLNGPQNIFMPLGMCVLQSGVVLRADMAKITLGKFCYVGRRAVLRPASGVFAWGVGFLAMTVGDFVLFGDECVVRAASIGSCVEVGARCVVGERCIVRDCVQILDDAVVPADTVLPPFTCWGGNPARLIKSIPESFARTQEWKAENLYQQLTETK
jgi:dynactin-5